MIGEGGRKEREAWMWGVRGRGVGGGEVAWEESETWRGGVGVLWCRGGGGVSLFGWIDQPEPLRLFPPKAGSRRPRVQTSPNPKSRKKIARLTHLTERERNSCISSTLEALGPE